jgi:hypothetical protein
MTNEEAILRLARDGDDESALIAIAENNGDRLKVAIGRHFSGRATRKKALNTLLVRISRRAKYFLPGQDDADRWIEHCAELECRRLQNESGNLVAGSAKTFECANATRRWVFSSTGQSMSYTELS